MVLRGILIVFNIFLRVENPPILLLSLQCLWVNGILEAIRHLHVGSEGLTLGYGGLTLGYEGLTLGYGGLTLEYRGLTLGYGV